MDQNNLSDSPKPRPVMDIRPQRPAAKPLARPNVPPPPRANYNPVPSPVPATPPVTEPVDYSSTDIPQTTQETPNETTPSNPAQVPPLAPKPKKPVAAIIIAVVVGLALSALTIFAYLKEQNKSNGKIPAVTQPQPEAVDASIEATDELNALDDDADFSPESLNDEALGL